MHIRLRQAAHSGSGMLLAVGAVILGLGASVLAIDMPLYFATQNQLQTTVDAAALAGAYALPEGEAQAEEAALELAAENMVANQVLDENNLHFNADKSKFTVTGEAVVPTIIGKLLCMLSNQGGGMNIEDGQIANDSNSQSGCSSMKIMAKSSAAPAARDTILVIDTSSSMDDVGGGRPMKDIKTAANKYIDIIAALNNESVDRIGLVSFNQTGTKQIGLTSQSQSPGFTSVKNKVTALSLFSGSGFNTNYEPGLKLALDELQNNGRKNARKIIIFMTDGMPNLPAPDSYYSYSKSEPYRKCIDPVHNSTAVKNLCYMKNKTKICPVLPSSAITDNMIPSSATQCMVTYVDAMADKTNTQTERAKQMDVTIHTVSLYDPNNQDNAQSIYRRLLKQPNWRPSQLDYMSGLTGGQKYEAPNYDANSINKIYEAIAQDIHVKLTN